jgi:hypothetical protein
MKKFYGKYIYYDIKRKFKDGFDLWKRMMNDCQDVCFIRLHYKSNECDWRKDWC